MKNPLLYTWLKLQTGLSNKHNSMSAFDMVGEKKILHVYCVKQFKFRKQPAGTLSANHREED